VCVQKCMCIYLYGMVVVNDDNGYRIVGMYSYPNIIVFSPIKVEKRRG